MLPAAPTPAVAAASPARVCGDLNHISTFLQEKGHRSAARDGRADLLRPEVRERQTLLPSYNSAYDTDLFLFNARQRSAKWATAACNRDFTVPRGISRMSLICLYGN